MQFKFAFFSLLLFFLVSFSIFSKCYGHLQSDIIYSPTPRASMDTPDAPFPTPMSTTPTPTLTFSTPSPRPRKANNHSTKVRAIFNFEARRDDEIDMNEGDNLYILEEGSNGWSKAFSDRTKTQGDVLSAGWIFDDDYIESFLVVFWSPHMCPFVMLHVNARAKVKGRPWRPGIRL